MRAPSVNCFNYRPLTCSQYGAANVPAVLPLTFQINFRSQAMGKHWQCPCLFLLYLEYNLSQANPTFPGNAQCCSPHFNSPGLDLTFHIRAAASHGCKDARAARITVLAPTPLFIRTMLIASLNVLILTENHLHQITSPSVNIWHHLPISSAPLMAYPCAIPTFLQKRKYRFLYSFLQSKSHKKEVPLS